MLLTIIVVSYNTKDLTLQTIKSAIADIAHSKLLNKKTEIFLVDNNSADGSVEAAREFKQKSKVPIKVFAKKENLGFAKANNIGVEKSSGKYIIFLNPDTIVRKGALESMVKRFEKNEKSSDKKLGILAATLLNTDFTLQAQGGSLPNLISLFFHMSMIDRIPFIGQFLPSTQHTGKNNRQAKYYSFTDNAINNKNISHNQLIKIGWVGGTALMAPKVALDEFGLLDGNIFMYGEDTEICLRARNHNFEVAIDPSAQIIHLQNQSSTSENAIRGEFKGFLYIFSKHFSRAKTEVAKVILQVGAILRIFVFSVIAKDEYKQSIYKNVLKDLK